MNTTHFSIYEKLIALKILEDKVKQLRDDLKAQVPDKSSMTTQFGKVTKAIQSRITIDGAVAYALLIERGINPMTYGECSVKLDESTVSRLVSLGHIPEDCVQHIVTESEYEVLRVTPDKDAIPALMLMARGTFTNLLENDNE